MQLLQIEGLQLLRALRLTEGFTDTLKAHRLTEVPLTNCGLTDSLKAHRFTESSTDLLRVLKFTEGSQTH